MASDALKKIEGTQVIYIGESKGVCITDGTFFNVLEKERVLYERISILQ
jgi:hypothetical protein